MAHRLVSNFCDGIKVWADPSNELELPPICCKRPTDWPPFGAKNLLLKHGDDIKCRIGILPGSQYKIQTRFLARFSMLFFDVSLKLAEESRCGSSILF